MTKVILGLLSAFLIVIAAAKIAYSITTEHGGEPVNQAWTQNRMEFVSWNNQKWTAWIHEDSFEQVPQNSSDWSRHSNVSIAFTNWDGEPWQAKVDGDAFLLAHHGDWQGTLTRSEAIRYRDWSGDNQLRTIAEIQR